MARGRKAGPSRLDRRREAEAAEAQEGEAVEVEEEEEAEEEGEEEEAEAAEESDEGEDEEGAKKKKKAPKKKAAPKAKKPATKRVRTPKEVRQKAVWVVFDNSSKRVDTFAYNEKAQAEALLAKKIQEKEGKATFYMNLVKEPIE
jgi:hypothetical protein